MKNFFNTLDTLNKYILETPKVCPNMTEDVIRVIIFFIYVFGFAISIVIGVFYSFVIFHEFALLLAILIALIFARYRVKKEENKNSELDEM